MLCPPPTTRKGHGTSCVTESEAIPLPLPSECWRLVYGDRGYQFLGYLGEHAYKGKESEDSFALKRAIFLEILNAGNFNKKLATKVAELSLGCVQNLARFAKACGTDTELGRFFLEVRTVALSWTVHERSYDLINAELKLLPEEIRQGVSEFWKSSQSKCDVKRERGHRYSDETVFRRVREAASFSKFYVESGKTAWAELNQRDVDGYIASSSNHTGGRIYPFIQFVKARYRAVSRVRRPKIRRAATLDVATDYRDMPAIVRKISKLEDPELVLAGLFLALYAQQISRSSSLLASDFMYRDGRFQVKFSEEWLPLDSLTAARLVEVCPEVKLPMTAGQKRIFLRSQRQLRRDFRDALGLDVKAVRLGALAALIRKGIRDRTTLVRLLGPSFNTVSFVEGMMEADFQQTVDPEIVEKRNRMFRGEDGG